LGPSVSRRLKCESLRPWLPTRWHWRWCEAPLERIAMLADFWKVIESLIVRSIHPQPKNRISRLRFMVELLQTCLSKWKPHRNMNRQNKFEDAFFLGWTHQRVPDKQKQIKTLTQPFLQCLGIPWETWGDLPLVSTPDPDRRAQKRWENLLLAMDGQFSHLTRSTIRYQACIRFQFPDRVLHWISTLLLPKISSWRFFKYRYHEWFKFV